VTLGPVEWLPSHGRFKMQLPVARLPLANLAGLWVVGGEVAEAPKQTSRWFVGAAFSVPL
jgi:hypothetical protein